MSFFGSLSGRALIAAVAGIMAGIATAPAHAQSVGDSTRSVYRIDPDEFIIGAWGPPHPASFNTQGNYGTAEGVWDWAEDIGVHLLHVPVYPQWPDLPYHTPEYLDALCHQADTLLGQGIIVKNAWPLWNLGGGREATFYPFDSLRLPECPTRFMSLQGGEAEYTDVRQRIYYEFPPTDPRHHRAIRYTPANTPNVNQPVASGIVYDWNAWQVYRFAYDGGANHDPDSVQNSDLLLSMTTSNNPYERCDTNTLFVVLTGLTESQTLDPSTGIYRIEIVQEIPEGGAYDVDGTTMVADDDIERLYATLTVPKSQLMPPQDEDPPDWRQYREAAFAVNLQNNGQFDGPLGELCDSKRFDVRVYWTGADTAVLRSVELRTPWAQTALGWRPADTSLRRVICDTIGRLLYGTGAWRQSSAGARRDSVLSRPIMGFTSGIEQHPLEASSLNGACRMLRDSFQLDEEHLPAWTEDGWQSSIHHLEQYPDVVTVEFSMYFQNEQWQALGSPYYRLPSIREHNGGRFPLSDGSNAIELLGTSRDSIEAYETALQRAYFGYNPGFNARRDAMSAAVRALAEAARLARDSSRRLVFVPFTTHRFNLVPGVSVLDTNIQHIPEAGELCAIVGLGLCYGSTGIWWQTLTGARNCFWTDAGTGWTLGEIDMGTNGGFHNDTAGFVAEFGLFNRGTDDGYLNSQEVGHVDNLYTGWGGRTREVKRINAWLHRIGPELVHLKWRDAYSVHATAPLPYDSTQPYRPIPSGEIVTQISAYAGHPDSTSPDPLSQTYVELGLFEPRESQSYPGSTEHHVFVVNRRTMARSDDLSTASYNGHQLDSLAETRAIAVRLNLPDHGQYRLVRVQEIAADTSRLPRSTAPRTALDTVLYAKGTVRLWLGPGQAALLRIIELPPADSIRASELVYNSQRKLLFDGRRYHAIYNRRNPFDSSGRIDTVFYSRSYPIADTLGSIRWEPVEYPVSTYFDSLQGPSMTYGNRHPSVTLRTQDGDTALAVVWTAEDNPEHWWRRRVLLRNIHSDTGTAPATLTPWIETVNTYVGSPDSAWGTPVIARLHAGEMIVHSDSALGVIARFRATGSGAQWWNNCGGYSTTMAVNPEPASPLMGKLPSLPTFAHVEGRDSNVALVWQQPYPGRTDILYKRLWQNPSLTLLQTPTLKLNVTTGQHCHPSIDQLQDPWRECQEITTWEGRTAGSMIQAIYSRATFTDNRATWDYDSVGTSGAFYEVMLHGRKNLAADAWPNISAIYARDLANPPVRHPMTSVSFNGYDSSSDSTMYEARVGYYLSTFTGLKTYTYGGRHQNGSACQDSGLGQQYRHAILYRSTQPQNPLLTTREYFLARSRPTGYVADGRNLAIALNDSTGSQLTMRVHDIWYADDANSSPLPLAPRPAQLGRVDSLAQLNALLRSASFAGHDSTLISLQIGGRFAGDTLGWSRARLTVLVDLIDSATQVSAARLDSFAVTTIDTSERAIERTLDLLSGTYYVRVSIDTAGFVPVSTATQEPYRLGVITEFVPSSLGKLVRSGPAAGTELRISVQPNPAARSAEVRFSVPDAQRVRVRLTDLWGKDIRVLLEEPELAAGRYALSVDVSGLAPGAYIVEVITERSAARCKLSVGGR